MSDGIRRIAALGILLLGTGLLWLTTRSTEDAANAKSDQESHSFLARLRAASNDPRLKGAYRYEEGGWVYVHLEGDPATVGYQHGFLLAPEIDDAFPAVKLEYDAFLQARLGIFPPSRPRNALAKN